MLFKKNQNIKSQPPASTNNAREEITAHLRLADKYLKEGNLNEAKQELDVVRLLEPNNLYALALEERRQALENIAKRKLAEQESEEIEEAPPITPPETDKAPIKEEESDLKKKAEKVPEKQETKKVVQEEQSEIIRDHSAVNGDVENELAATVAEIKRSMARTRFYEERLKSLGIKLPSTREEMLCVYMARLREAWASPPVTAEAERELKQMHDTFGLSPDDHLQCESEVRLQAYATEVEKEIRIGLIKPNDERSLENLKHKFKITPEESAKLEQHIIAAFKCASTKAIILVVDDEIDFLEIIKSTLEKLGYGVIAKQSPTEAMKLLETTDIDLIISDIMFTGTEGDGFSFYEKLQKVQYAKKIPFILMSGLHESFFINGVQLGVDSYLTKPIDTDMLAAVVEGKLKKYRSIRDSN